MFLQLVFLISVLISSAFSHDIAQRCPTELLGDRTLKVFGDRCYVFEVNQLKTFRDAHEHCLDNGGNLAMPKSQKINDFLQNELKNGFENTDRNFWIGIESIPVRSFGFEPSWVDGTSTDYVNYYYSNYKGSMGCGTMWVETGKWFLVACTSIDWNMNEKHPFVCEFPRTNQEIITIAPPKTTTNLMLNKTILTQTTTSTATSSSTSLTKTPTSTIISKLTPPTTKMPTTSTAKPSMSTLKQTQSATTIPTTTTTATVTTTCRSIICELDCDLDGYITNPVTGCLECACNH